MSEAPAEYKQAGLFMTISAVMHILVGAFSVLMGLATCLGTYGLCCFCPFIGFVPIAIGTFELLVANQMREGVWVANARQANLTGLVVAMVTMSALNVVLEALAMSQLNQAAAKAYLDQGPEALPG